MLSKLHSVGTPGWLRSFLQRHKSKIHQSTRKRALEIRKTAKNQVELVLYHFRNVYDAELMAMIQRNMVLSDSLTTGYYHFENIIQTHHTMSSTSLFRESEQSLIVRDLKKPLEHIPAKYRFGLDETPIIPDSPLLSALTTTNSVPLSYSGASVWTLLPVLRGDGTVLSCCILQKCKSLLVDIMNFTSQNGVCVGSTENSQQTDEMWLQFAKVR